MSAEVTLVTGGGGFAGGHLIDLLVARAQPVVAWHRPGESPAARDGVVWRAVDILQADDVRAAVNDDQPGRVYHCAGAAHVGHAWDRTADTLATNVLGTHHLLDALRRVRPDARVLIPSSALVYVPSDQALTEEAPLRPANPYGLSKLAQEMLGIGTVDGPRVWVARPFNHFGPRQSSSFVTAAFARQIAEIEAGLQPPEIAVGNLEARRDLTDVRDTVNAYTRILEHGVAERPYNVCSGTALRVQELLDRLLQRAHCAIRVVVDPSRYRPNDTPLVLGSHQRITTELGWRPDLSADQTLDDLLDYCRRRTAS